MKRIWNEKDGESPDKSLLGRIAKMALEKAVETLVEEGVEAAVEIWRSYQMKLQDEHFEARKDERDDESDGADRERREYPGVVTAFAEAVSGKKSRRVDERPDRPTGQEASEADGAAGTRLESFGTYVDQFKGSDS